MLGTWAAILDGGSFATRQDRGEAPAATASSAMCWYRDRQPGDRLIGRRSNALWPMACRWFVVPPWRSAGDPARRGARAARWRARRRCRRGVGRRRRSVIGFGAHKQWGETSWLHSRAAPCWPDCPRPPSSAPSAPSRPGRAQHFMIHGPTAGGGVGVSAPRDRRRPVAEARPADRGRAEARRGRHARKRRSGRAPRRTAIRLMDSERPRRHRRDRGRCLTIRSTTSPSSARRSNSRS